MNLPLNIVTGTMLAYTSVYHVHTGSPWRGRERVADLELELQMAVGHHVGVGNRTWGLWKSSQCS